MSYGCATAAQGARLIALPAALIAFAGWWLSYTCFGRRLIEAIYAGRSLPLLNRLIQDQAALPLACSLKKADRLFVAVNAEAAAAVAAFLWRFPGPGERPSHMAVAKACPKPASSAQPTLRMTARA